MKKIYRVVELFIAGFIISWIVIGAAKADEFALVQSPLIRYEVRVIDPNNVGEVKVRANVEARAVTILRNDGLTLEEARAKVRVNGVTDIARCTEVILSYAMRTASIYLDVQESQIGLQHEAGKTP